ncbi:MAG: cytochrome c [Gammaproteobacteria bacterium]|nr:cytochrome c [Gammaproteobacteria bacterium]
MRRVPCPDHSVRALAFALATALVPATTVAGELPRVDDAIVNTGHTLFAVHCASCHGDDAAGGAATTSTMTRPTPDLTTLAARNGGRFPFWGLYDVISGAELLPAHADRTMPLWSRELVPPHAADAEDGAALARGRILAIMAYLATLQHD